MNTTQIDQLNTVATRLRQSGKTTLAGQVEAIIKEHVSNANSQGNSNGYVAPLNANVQRKVEGIIQDVANSANVDITAEDLSNVNEYIPQNGELELAASCVIGELNLLLTGPAGCGKTHLIRFLAKKLGRELFTIQGGAGATFERIVAQDTLIESNGVTITSRQLSVLPIAMKRGAILYIDEPNGVPPEVLFYLHSAMDDRRSITFANGETLTAASGFVVIGAMNEGYRGTSLLNEAFRSRCESIIDMHYLPADREAKLLQDRTGVDPDSALKLAKAAEQLRGAMAAKQIRTPIATRALLAASKLIKLHVPVARALEVTLVNQTPAQYANERRAVADVLAAHFGQKVA